MGQKETARIILMDELKHCNPSKLLLLLNNWSKLIAVFIDRLNNTKKLLINYVQKSPVLVQESQPQLTKALYQNRKMVSIHGIFTQRNPTFYLLSWLIKSISMASHNTIIIKKKGNRFQMLISRNGWSNQSDKDSISKRC